MKHITTILLTLAAALTATAQEGHFGYINYRETLMLMPEYAQAQETIQTIQQEYEQEIERADTEFYRQYMEYLHGQKMLSSTIILKRQKELQQLYENSMEFKKNFRDSLSAERKALLEPLERKLLDAISTVSRNMGLEYVIDMSSHSYLYIDPEKGNDISHPVYKLLGIEYKEATDTENIPQPVTPNQ